MRLTRHWALLVLVPALTSCAKVDQNRVSPGVEELLSNTYSWAAGSWRAKDPSWMTYRGLGFSANPARFSYEKRGTALELLFETTTLPVTTECTFLMVADHMSIDTIEGSDQFKVRYKKDRYVLISDGKNDPRCADEIKRLNAAVGRYDTTYELGPFYKAENGAMRLDHDVFERPKD